MRTAQDVQVWWDALSALDRATHVVQMQSDHPEGPWARSDWTLDWAQLTATQRLMLSRYYRHSHRRAAPSQ